MSGFAIKPQKEVFRETAATELRVQATVFDDDTGVVSLVADLAYTTTSGEARTIVTDGLGTFRVRRGEWVEWIECNLPVMLRYVLMNAVKKILDDRKANHPSGG